MDVGNLARVGVAKMALWSGWSLPSRWVKGRLTVLRLHRILPEKLKLVYPHPELVTTPAQLRWLLATLSDHFEFVTVSEGVERLANDAIVKKPGRRGPKPPLALTFDEAQWDAFGYAAPILAERNIRATFYAPVDSIGRDTVMWHDRVGFAAIMGKLVKVPRTLLRDIHQLTKMLKKKDIEERRLWMNDHIAADFIAPDWARTLRWNEAGDLARQGHEIGSHGFHHEFLDKCDGAEARFELEHSKSALEEALGIKVRSFSYPNGNYTPETMRLAEEVGYTSCVTVARGLNDASTDPMELRRYEIDPANIREGHAMSEERLLYRFSKSAA